MKIGLSVSLCIRDILAGTVNEKDVKKIIGSTCCRTAKDWKEVIADYRQYYWKNNPDEGEAILRRLLKARKIEQPRLKGQKAHNIASGHWR